ncbi:Secreted effector protein PipB2 [Ensifer sp. M14]|jgi:uncharacterized protein YjbI with pentapeptide repeats|nr:Secreted effector protein PipB2 [Ensifer sp. M14]
MTLRFRPSRTDHANEAVTNSLCLTLVWCLVLAFNGSAHAAHCKSWPAPGLNWSSCDKSRLMLAGANLEGANLFGADFSMTDLRESHLNFANFEKAKLVRASLAGANADNAAFTRIEAHRANFVAFSAQAVSFAGAELQRADFGRARLKKANFEKAELGRAKFVGAKLKDVRFTLANLSRADFSGASFAGSIELDQAILFLTRLEGVDISAATGLRQSQIDAACGDAATKLPRGISAPKSWPCMFD